MFFLCDYFGVLLDLFSLVVALACWHHPSRVMIGRYFVKRTALFVILIAAMGMSSCGSYSLRTINLAISNNNLGTTANELKGLGSWVQFSATGNYSNYTSKDLSQRVTYNIVVTSGSVDANGAQLPAPPNGAQLSLLGLVTAVAPGVCTYVQTGTNPITYALTGTYTVTATFGGVTSNPVYVGVASAAGPSGNCGP